MPQDPPIHPFFPHAKRVPDHESPVRRFFSDAHHLPYHPLRSLEEARAHNDGVVVFEGDNGGQIYLVVPAVQIVCTEKTLRHLLEQLDEIEWPSDDGCGARIYFECRPAGSGVAGGMGGGAVTGDLWLHSHIMQRGLESDIRDVIEGRAAEIPPDIMQRNVPTESEDGITLTEEQFHHRLATAIDRSIDKAQGDVAEPLPRNYRLRLQLFRQCGKERDASFDEAMRYLYVDGAFPRSVNVSVCGVLDDRTVISLDPLGRQYVRHARENAYLADVAPFFPRGLVPIAKRPDMPLVSHTHLAAVAAYLIHSADERTAGMASGPDGEDNRPGGEEERPHRHRSEE